MKKVLSFLFILGLVFIVASCEGFGKKDAVSQIEITTAPTAVRVLKGQELSLEGLVVTAIYESGKEEVVANDELTVTGYDANRVGTQTITVTYSEKTATFTITVVEDTVEDESIKLPYLPR